MVPALILASLIHVPSVPQELAPGTIYDPAIPTLADVVDHDFREEVTPADQIVRYMEALAAAAPDRTRLRQYAESWEGRPLVILVIGSPDRIGRLDDIRADLGRLADPWGLSDADALIDRVPVVTALTHGVHGNERARRRPAHRNERIRHAGFCSRNGSLDRDSWQGYIVAWWASSARGEKP